MKLRIPPTGKYLYHSGQWFARLQTYLRYLSHGVMRGLPKHNTHPHVCLTLATLVIPVNIFNVKD